jgi:SPP1 gp7 family putative phage head morphogenesis protein
MSTPETFYREAIDLNRYSNQVARQIVTNYNNVILDLTNKLATIDEVTAPATVARIRAMLVQMKESLESWSETSSLYLVDELQGLAVFQTEFVKDQLERVLPKGTVGVNSVQISPDFARSVVFTDPTEVNILTLPTDLESTVQKTFNLTAAKGSAITLPSGQVAEKAFRGISTKQAELISSQIRIGITEGESIPKIAKRLRGRLQFGTNQNMTAKAQRLAGGDGMKLANNQVMTIVRTSVNQVQNSVNQATYAANEDVTQRYEYVATLDARTSAICGSLDGRTFKYGEGPMPPQHFNCRSTTVPIIDDEDLRRRFPDTRPSATGRVPQGMNYATWLKDNPSIQTDALGNKKRFFNYLIDKKRKSPREALRLIIKDDGTELPLKELIKKYPNAT